MAMALKRKFSSNCVQCNGNSMCVSSDSPNEVSVRQECSNELRVFKKVKKGETVSSCDIEILEVLPGKVSRHVEIIHIEPAKKKDLDIEIVKYVPGNVSANHTTATVDLSDIDEKNVDGKQLNNDFIDLTSPSQLSTYHIDANNYFRVVHIIFISLVS